MGERCSYSSDIWSLGVTLWVRRPLCLGPGLSMDALGSACSSGRCSLLARRLPCSTLPLPLPSLLVSCPTLLLCPPPHAPFTLTRPQEICTGEKPRRGQLREIQVPQEAPAEGERTVQHSAARHSSL